MSLRIVVDRTNNALKTALFAYFVSTNSACSATEQSDDAVLSQRLFDKLSTSRQTLMWIDNELGLSWNTVVIAKTIPSRNIRGFKRRARDRVLKMNKHRTWFSLIAIWALQRRCNSAGLLDRSSSPLSISPWCWSSRSDRQSSRWPRRSFESDHPWRPRSRSSPRSPSSSCLRFLRELPSGERFLNHQFQTFTPNCYKKKKKTYETYVNKFTTCY